MNARKIKKAKEPIECANCGLKFTPKTKEVYCSHTCKVEDKSINCQCEDCTLLYVDEGMGSEIR